MEGQPDELLREHLRDRKFIQAELLHPLDDSMALYQRGEDEVHVTAGFGLAFRNIQIDFGIDISDLVDTVSVSAIYKFGK